MRLDPIQEAELLADADAMRELVDSPIWARYVELIEKEEQGQIAYLLALPPERESAKLVGVVHGLRKALNLPQAVIEMSRQVRTLNAPR